MLGVIFSCSLVLVGLGDDSAAPPESHRLEEGHAPTPFSAEQIRSTCVPGHWTKFKLWTSGKDSRYQTTTFRRDAGDRTEFEVVTHDLDGNAQGEPVRATARWKDLQAHASFPESHTKIETTRVKTPAGEFEAWLYLVRTESEGQKDEKRFWFAKNLPGPPILLEHRRGGEMVFKMTLVAKGFDKAND